MMTLLKQNILFLTVFVLFLLMNGCDRRSTVPQRRPNLVLIVADDLGYGDLGAYGGKDIKTPHLDRLAKEGVRFTQFYANGPECTPTRAALMTGKYQQRIGGLECAIGAGNIGRYDEAAWLGERRQLGLPAGECLLPVALKEAGYATAIVGKWHLGYEPHFRPDRQGFDYSFGPIGFGGDYFYHVEKVSINQPDFQGGHNLAQNGKEVFRDGEYLTELIGGEAIEWMHSLPADQPFFLYLPYTSPHDPYQGPNDRIGRPLQGEEWGFKSREKYVEMVESLDKSIGEVLTAIERRGLSQETLVVFFSDNGGTGIADNGVLRGFKGQVYEGGIRVPCIVRWPGHIAQNSLSHQSAISVDITRSLLEVAGVETDSFQLDGYPLISHVVDKRPDMDRTLFWRLKRGDRVRKAVREGDLKYIEELEKDLVVTTQLFNLKSDPSESHDLFPEASSDVLRLKEKLNQWETEVEAPRLHDYRKKQSSP